MLSVRHACCGICTEELNAPVALPCGHLFCEECISRAVEAVIPFTTLHSCPACHASYNIADVDISSVPAQLRPHILPSIRRLCTDFPNGKSEEPRTVSGMTEIAIENSRLHAENEALKNTCAMWRRRAELHGAATLGLLGFARIAKDQALRMRYERDEVYKHYNLLRQELPKSETCQHPAPPPLSTSAELPPLPSVPQSIEVKLAPSLSRRSQTLSTAEAGPPRATKRPRITGLSD
ncbi:hypothetical protein E4T56_gene12401 [Termitomyces sp. T112]|nr:hypothetical protein E4T56_gene12401 [Termitomyces sp. T112]KAH0583027.1 hypothetical protein H2248_010914 [Termitomyces sp. 'cryptogamus']